MIVDPKDGRCRSCGGTLEITDADDATMLVECKKCGETYEVETDAFNDGGMTYYLGIMEEKLREGDVA
jgi:transcription elongation factor Elf1